MGYFFDHLVPAAILFDHPGISREDFACFLQHAQPEKYSFGLFSVARVLGLPYSSSFCAFDQSQGVALDFPYTQWYSLEDLVEELHDPRLVNHGYFRLQRRSHRVLSGRLVLQYSQPLQTGPLFEGISLVFSSDKPHPLSRPSLVVAFYNMDEGRIVRVARQESQAGLFRAVCKVEFLQITSSFADPIHWTQVACQYPSFSADAQYDWSARSGWLGIGDFGRRAVLWYQEDGKYFVDRDALLASLVFSRDLHDDRFTYSDLILTTEACRHGSSAILGRNGLDFKDNFLSTHSESRARHQQAVFDETSSFLAQHHGWHVSELLRRRLLGDWRKP